MLKKKHPATARHRDEAKCESVTRYAHDSLPDCTCHRCRLLTMHADTRRAKIVAELQSGAELSELIPPAVAYAAGGATWLS